MKPESFKGQLEITVMYDLKDHLRIHFTPKLEGDPKRPEFSQVSKRFFQDLKNDNEQIYQLTQLYKTQRAAPLTNKINFSELRNISILEEEDPSILEERMAKDPEEFIGKIGIIISKVLKRIGRQIYQNLFPNTFKEEIKKGTISAIIIISQEFIIPYEIMHDGESFLATKIAFYRKPILEDIIHPNVTSTIQNQPFHIVLFSNPTGDLPASEEEITQIKDVFDEIKKDLNIKVEIEEYSNDMASYRTLKKIFLSDRLDIFHYCGHSGVTKGDIHFNLTDGPFSVMDISLPYPAFIFLNMCESDIQLGQNIDFIGQIKLNFPMEFMQGGAKACLATLWPIDDRTASQFALYFYKKVLSGENFGDAIHYAKSKLAEIPDFIDLTWLSFVLYGSPTDSNLDLLVKSISFKKTSFIESPEKEKPLVSSINIEHLNKKGLRLMVLGKYKEALECFDKIFETNPQYLEAWINKGAVLHELAKYKEAIACYETALEIDLNSKQAWSNMGFSKSMLGSYDEAIRCFNKALEIDPNFTKAWNYKGITLSLLAKLDEAIICFDKALENNPNYGEAWNYKGLTLRMAGRHKEAISSYNKSLSIYPNDKWIWFNKGIAFFEVEEYKEAINCYNEAIKIDPQYLDAWNYKGIALSTLGAYQEAILCYDKYINIDPKNKEVWNYLGVAWYELGEYEKAIKCYEKALEIDKNYSEAQDNKELAKNLLHYNQIGAPLGSEIVAEIKDAYKSVSNIENLQIIASDQVEDATISPLSARAAVNQELKALFKSGKKILKKPEPSTKEPISARAALNAELKSVFESIKDVEPEKDQLEKSGDNIQEISPSIRKEMVSELKQVFQAIKELDQKEQAVQDKKISEAAPTTKLPMSGAVMAELKQVFKSIREKEKDD